MLEAGFKTRAPVAADAEFGPYWRRQYVFVAATMPAITPDDVGSQIERLFPDAKWVASSALHTSKPSVQHTWLEVRAGAAAATAPPCLRSRCLSPPATSSRRSVGCVATTLPGGCG